MTFSRKLFSQRSSIIYSWKDLTYSSAFSIHRVYLNAVSTLGVGNLLQICLYAVNPLGVSFLRNLGHGLIEFERDLNLMFFSELFLLNFDAVFLVLF